MTTPGTGELKHVPVNQALRDYLRNSCTPLDPVTASLVERTAAIGAAAGMMVPVEQAALLTLLARIQSARTVLDIGTFTGLSALALAQGVVPGGRVITCDITDQWLELARDHWRRAEVAERIEFRREPAGRLLASLADGPPLDLVFVDADKINYLSYCQQATALLRPGGLLVVDNVLLDGYVMAPELAGDKLLRRSAEKLREVNAALAADQRLHTVMLPIADGVTIARRH